VGGWLAECVAGSCVSLTAHVSVSSQRNVCSWGCQKWVQDLHQKVDRHRIASTVWIQFVWSTRSRACLLFQKCVIMWGQKWVQDLHQKIDRHRIASTVWIQFVWSTRSRACLLFQKCVIMVRPEMGPGSAPKNGPPQDCPNSLD